jgi:hypothetical protein
MGVVREPPLLKRLNRRDGLWVTLEVDAAVARPAGRR